MPIHYKGWWTNESMLKSQNIQSVYDFRSDSVLFNQHINSGMATNINVIGINQYELRNGSFTFDMLLNQFDMQWKQSLDYVHPGPSNVELRNPAISNAWDEFQLIYRLSK